MISEAIKIEEGIQEPSPARKSVQLAKLYKVRGALCEFMGRKTEAKKMFTKAVDIYRAHGLVEIHYELDEHIKQLDMEDDEAQFDTDTNPFEDDND